MRVYSIFDRKLKEYGQLVTQRNDEAVRRSLVDGVRGSGSTLEKHPQDFDIMVLGEFDPETGVLITMTPQLVANVGDVLESYPSAGGVNAR